MRNIVITLLAALIPMLASGQEWIETGKNDSQTWYIYKNIQDEYGNHLVWVKTTYDTPEARKQAMNDIGTKYHVFEDKTLFCFNSEWSKLYVKSVSAYSKSGKVLSSYNANYEDWDYIAPETIAATIRDLAKYIYENPMP
ncbi:unknown [Prevotella sp. CAG:1124]|nr:unknown [Prevotella sp. CAG:1124]